MNKMNFTNRAVGSKIVLRNKKRMPAEKKVLIIDDDEEDLQLLEEALKAVDVNLGTVHAKDGIEGMAVLEHMLNEGPLPCLIVLDINMPRMDGKETFIAIRSNEKLCDLPIVIFSTSASVLDKNFFERHNTAYFVKPINFSTLVSTASRMVSICYHQPDTQQQ